MTGTQVPTKDVPAKVFADTPPDTTGGARVTVIRPAPRWPHLDIPELWHYRELLFRLTWRDVSVRYKQTSIGVTWAILQPFLTMVAFTLVFGKFADFPSKGIPYPIFTYSALLPWTYFASSVAQSSNSLVSNRSLVTRVYFPRILLPLAGVTVPIVDFLLAFIVLVGMMVWFTIWPSLALVLAPLFLLMGGVDCARGRSLSVRHQRPVSRRPVRDSVPHPDLALLLRCRLRDQRTAREVAVGARAEPDDGRDQRLPVGGRQHGASESRPDRRQRGGDGRDLRRRPLVLPPLRAEVRGHDLMAAIAVSVENLSKLYRIGELQSAYGTLRDSMAGAGRRIVHRDHRPHYEEIWAVKDVSFELREGEVLGIIGRNGAGKSTLLRILTRITSPTSGRAVIRGRVGSLLEVGTGFHPELTGRENVFLNGSVLGMRRRDIARKFPEIVEFAGVEQFIDTPVKRYSSGMSVRLAFAVAAHLEPEVLLIDEVLAVGDAEFQRRCLGRMEDSELLRAHGHLRLAPDADRLAALRAGDLDGEGRDAARRPELRGRRSLPPIRASAAGRAVRGPISRPHRVTIS